MVSGVSTLTAKHLTDATFLDRDKRAQCANATDARCCSRIARPKIDPRARGVSLPLLATRRARKSSTGFGLQGLRRNAFRSLRENERPAIKRSAGDANRGRRGRVIGPADRGACERFGSELDNHAPAAAFTSSECGISFALRTRELKTLAEAASKALARSGNCGSRSGFITTFTVASTWFASIPETSAAPPKTILAAARAVHLLARREAKLRRDASGLAAIRSFRGDARCSREIRRAGRLALSPVPSPEINPDPPATDLLGICAA